MREEDVLLPTQAQRPSSIHLKITLGTAPSYGHGRDEGGARVVMAEANWTV